MYQEVFELQAELLKALAHPKRLEILHLLRYQSLNVSEMVEMLGLPQANLSQHLMVMREAGVVESQKVGKEVFYRLSEKNFVKASDLLREVLIKKHKGERVADELAFKMQDLWPVVIDPVCGMRLSPKTAGYAVRKNGESYYFCAEGCMEKFKHDTSRYINLKKNDDE